MSMYDRYNRTGELPPLEQEFPWSWGVWGLLALLLLQVILFKGAVLAQNPLLRPAIEDVSKTFGFPIPPFKNVATLRIVDRSLRTQLDGSGTLEFKLTLINLYSLPQAYPDLKLVLHELDGRPIAERVMTPAEYLDDDPSRGPTLPAGRPVEIRFYIVKPRADIGGFTFELL